VVLPGGFARLSGGGGGGGVVRVRFCGGFTGTLDCAIVVDANSSNASNANHVRALMVPPSLR
jgi:hypothetical protein